MNLSFLECNDVEWFAADESGRVAVFTTGGSIYVPRYWADAIEELQDFSKRIAKLPSRGGFKLVPDKRSAYDYSSWTELAKKGIFGYDFDMQVARGYRLMAIPESPLQIEECMVLRGQSVPVFQSHFGYDSVFVDREAVKDWVPARRRE